MSVHIFVVSLGCAKNQVDTETMLGTLHAAGVVLCPHPEEADVLLVNTCAFIAAARNEAAREVRKLARGKRAGQKLVVCGCLAETHRAAFERKLHGVDAWVAIGGERGIRDIIAQWFPLAHVVRPAPRLLVSPRHYAYLRVADGCDHGCAFCTIPGIRGPFRSVAPRKLVQEARRLADAGVVELNLIAQDTSGYGRDMVPRTSLADLLGKLCDIVGIEWIRLQYLYPATVTNELLDTMAGSMKICPYIDLPLQHIADKVLRAMRRPGRAFTEALLGRIRTRVPGAVMRTTLIVGHPGETEREFAELLRFVESSRFHHLGVFAYSREPGTASASMDSRTDAKERARRRDAVMRLQQRIAREHTMALVGTTVPVLVDAVGPNGAAQGRQAGDAPGVDNMVHIRPHRLCRPGLIVPVRIVRTEPYDVFGECTGQEMA